jgi:acyl-CoA thioesterase
MNSQELPENVFRKMMDKDWFSQWMGIECVKITQGSCELKMKVRKEMLNGFGIIHGGLLFSLADSALAFAANSHGRISLSIEASVSFVDSVHEDDELIAIATEVSNTNKFGVYDILVCKRQAEKVALFRGTVYRTSKNHFE